MLIKIPIKALLAVFYTLCIVALVVIIAVYVTGRMSDDAGTGAGETPMIIIDAGHGGFDGGAVADDDTYEKDLNLGIALKLRDFFTAFGFDVTMVRDSDTSVETSGSTVRERKVSDMKNRLALMNKYSNSTTISIHINKFSLKSSNGAQVFYASSDGSKLLAECIQTSIASKLQTNNDRVVKQGTKSTYILYNAKFPAVIVECGFLSNAADLANLKDETYQSKLAFAIVSGYLNYYYAE